jgi:asparagine synthase (glutamine-hydrolysing)
MAHSIEGRVPFLDHRLVEFAFRLPGDYKIHGVRTKHVLREALVGTIPESVRTRSDKIGFQPDPDITWRFADRNRESLLASGTAFEERWFDHSACAGLLDSANRSVDREFLLLRVISTKLWLRNHWA